MTTARSADEIKSQRKKLKRKIESVGVVQLPLWSEYLRGIPGEVARSSLFNARNRRTKRRNYTGETLFAMGDIEVTYRGEELRQEDELVWLQVLHLARVQPLAEWVEFVPANFMRELGWRVLDKSAYVRLRTILERLQATALTISSKRHKSGVSLSLLRKFQWKEEQPLKMWRVWLEGEMQELFPEGYPRLMWEQRLDLPAGLASKLHSYFSAHKEPLPVKTENLQKLCGSRTARLRKFNEQLATALDRLVESGFLESYMFEDNILHVKRK